MALPLLPLSHPDPLVVLAAIRQRLRNNPTIPEVVSLAQTAMGIHFCPEDIPILEILELRIQFEELGIQHLEVDIWNALISLDEQWGWMSEYIREIQVEDVEHILPDWPLPEEEWWSL